MSSVEAVSEEQANVLRQILGGQTARLLKIEGCDGDWLLASSIASAHNLIDTNFPNLANSATQVGFHRSGQTTSETVGVDEETSCVDSSLPIDPFRKRKRSRGNKALSSQRVRESSEESGLSNRRPASEANMAQSDDLGEPVEEQSSPDTASQGESVQMADSARRLEETRYEKKATWSAGVSKNRQMEKKRGIRLRKSIDGMIKGYTGENELEVTSVWARNELLQVEQRELEFLCPRLNFPDTDSKGLSDLRKYARAFGGQDVLIRVRNFLKKWRMHATGVNSDSQAGVGGSNNLNTALIGCLVKKVAGPREGSLVHRIRRAVDDARLIWRNVRDIDFTAFRTAILERYLKARLFQLCDETRRLLESRELEGLPIDAGVNCGIRWRNNLAEEAVFHLVNAPAVGGENDMMDVLERCIQYRATETQDDDLERQSESERAELAKEIKAGKRWFTLASRFGLGSLFLCGKDDVSRSWLEKLGDKPFVVWMDFMTHSNPMLREKSWLLDLMVERLVTGQDPPTEILHLEDLSLDIDTLSGLSPTEKAKLLNPMLGEFEEDFDEEFGQHLADYLGSNGLD